MHKHLKTSWWFQPLWKIFVRLDHFPNFRGENKTYLKPPPIVYIFPLQSKSAGYQLYQLDAKSRVWHWHDATKTNLAGYSPQVKRSKSSKSSRIFVSVCSLCDGFWDVSGRFLVGSTSGQLLAHLQSRTLLMYLTNPPQLQKHPPCKAKNPKILALFSRLPWTYQMLCNHVTWFRWGKAFPKNSAYIRQECSMWT